MENINGVKNVTNTLNVDKHDFTMHDIGKYEVVSFDKHAVYVMWKDTINFNYSHFSSFSTNYIVHLNPLWGHRFDISVIWSAHCENLSYIYWLLDGYRIACWDSIGNVTVKCLDYNI